MTRIPISTTGVGITPNIFPRYQSPKLKSIYPPGYGKIHSAIPAKAVEVANVASNGLIRIIPTINPLNMPHNTALNSPSIAACGTENPFSNAVTITTFTSDTIEPSEISVPATRIVAVTPIATQIAPAFVEMKDRKKDTLNPPVIIPLIPRKITKSSNILSCNRFTFKNCRYMTFIHYNNS